MKTEKRIDPHTILIVDEIEPARWPRSAVIDLSHRTVETFTNSAWNGAATTSEPARKPHVDDRSYFRRTFGQRKRSRL
jgi:hypothetical protein